MERYAIIADDKTFAFSAENPTGERNGGTQGSRMVFSFLKYQKVFSSEIIFVI